MVAECCCSTNAMPAMLCTVEISTTTTGPVQTSATAACTRLSRMPCLLSLHTTTLPAEKIIHAENPPGSLSLTRRVPSFRQDAQSAGTAASCHIRASNVLSSIHIVQLRYANLPTPASCWTGSTVHCHKQGRPAVLLYSTRKSCTNSLILTGTTGILIELNTDRPHVCLEHPWQVKTPVNVALFCLQAICGGKARPGHGT